MIVARTTVVATALVLAASPALARHRHHVAPAASIEDRAPSGFGSDAYPGEAVARAAAANQNAPGLTRELAPDARQTATGGPVGGVPGFSGH